MRGFCSRWTYLRSAGHFWDSKVACNCAFFFFYGRQIKARVKHESPKNGQSRVDSSSSIVAKEFHHSTEGHWLDSRWGLLRLISLPRARDKLQILFLFSHLRRVDKNLIQISASYNHSPKRPAPAADTPCFTRWSPNSYGRHDCMK